MCINFLKLYEKPIIISYSFLDTIEILGIAQTQYQPGSLIIYGVKQAMYNTQKHNDIYAIKLVNLKDMNKDKIA